MPTTHVHPRATARRRSLACSATAVLAAFFNPVALEGHAFTPGRGPARRLNVQLGPRPYFLLDDLDPGPLKTRLEQCSEGPFRRSHFSIGHRGAPLQFPEHTRESYVAAARMGAGALECDVTFTKHRELVCRHSQCDLHTATNILAVPELRKEVLRPVHTRRSEHGHTGDCPVLHDRHHAGRVRDAVRQDGRPSIRTPTTVEEYMAGTPRFRTDLYSAGGTLAR